MTTFAATNAVAMNVITAASDGACNDASPQMP
jgi:hypothetical protein